MADGVSIQFDTARFTARLNRFLDVTTRETERVVFETAAVVKSDIQVGWPVDTGASRAGWWGPRKIAPLAYQLGNPFRYALPIEYGGYPNPGEKTVRFAGERLTGGFQVNPGVYPRQRPAAPVRRALAKHHGRLTREIRDIHQREWGR